MYAFVYSRLEVVHRRGTGIHCKGKDRVEGVEEKQHSSAVYLVSVCLS